MMSAAQPSNGKRQNESVWSALGLAWELGYVIALPILCLGFGGAYVDKYLGTSPLFIISGFVIAFCISAFTIYKKVKEITGNIK